MNAMDWYRRMTSEEMWTWWQAATPEQRHCFDVLLRRQMSLTGRAFRDAMATTEAAIRAFGEAVRRTLPPALP
jgi:hypothetical protein